VSYQDPYYDEATRVQPPGEQPPELATVDQVRGVRRWLWVVAIWAAAATAVALIAVLGGGDSGDPGASASQVSALERELDDRIGQLEQQIEMAPTTDEVDELRTQVRELDQGGTEAEEVQEAAQRAEEEVADLTERVDDLERQVEEQDSSGSGSDEPLFP
jgi:methyl-accepting chemotaxis protein